MKFSVQQKQVSPTEVDVLFTAKIDKGWHVYSTDIPDGGPQSAVMHTEKAEGAQPMGALIKQGKEISEDDKIFGMRVRYFENNVTFVQKYKITGKTYQINGYLEYGACNDEMCMPPSTVDFDFSGKGPEEAPAPEPQQKEESKADPVKADASALETAVAILAVADTVAVASADSIGAALPVDSAAIATVASKWWEPRIDELKTLNGGNISDRSWIYIFLMGLLYGLLAVFTPCVWPIIPMTVSFFLKRSKDKKKGSSGRRRSTTWRRMRCSICCSVPCSWSLPCRSSDGSNLPFPHRGPTRWMRRHRRPVVCSPSSSWPSRSPW